MTEPLTSHTTRARDSQCSVNLANLKGLVSTSVVDSLVQAPGGTDPSIQSPVRRDHSQNPLVMPNPPSELKCPPPSAGPPAQIHQNEIATAIATRQQPASAPPAPQRPNIQCGVVASQFLPPLPKSIGFSDFFPLLDASVVLAIMTHELHPGDLWKLDTRDSAVNRHTSLTRTLYVSARSGTSPSPAHGTAKDPAAQLKRFPTLNALLVPLTVYFRIVQAFLSFCLPFPGQSGSTSTQEPAHGPYMAFTVSNAIHAYLAHLVDLEERYDWPVVLAYHMCFHERRRVQMAVARGSGRGGPEVLDAWGQADGELMAKLLFGREKNRAVQCSVDTTAWIKDQLAARGYGTAESVAVKKKKGKKGKKGGE
ncbi:hypothetical protein H0H81_008511 [Sphagnurus paluster]|uniref:Uncharacterized protein n=1 Tax=Sphagnurus paluster TaxID=117069 RepID=A0A9P7KK86_9AGAR|nr:hypothetical protein H0H81_008511 [Sphagnurus paluster]